MIKTGKSTSHAFLVAMRGRNAGVSAKATPAAFCNALGVAGRKTVTFKSDNATVVSCVNN